jgi:hypothetical protein
MVARKIVPSLGIKTKIISDDKTRKVFFRTCFVYGASVKMEDRPQAPDKNKK